MKPDLEQLKIDLRPNKQESFPSAAKRLVKLGYRVPDCPERWQVDRMTGVLLAAANSSGYDSIAQVLIDLGKLEMIEQEPRRNERKRR